MKVFTADLIDELEILALYNLDNHQEGLKVHNNASNRAQMAITRLHEKGLVTQADGKLRYLNPQAEALFGFSSEGARNLHLLELLPDLDPLLLNSPQALKACKDLLLEVGDGDFSADLRQTTEQAIARLRTSPEGQEGLSAFLEKRTPAWQEKK